MLNKKTSLFIPFALLFTYLTLPAEAVRTSTDIVTIFKERTSIDSAVSKKAYATPLNLGMTDIPALLTTLENEDHAVCAMAADWLAQLGAKSELGDAKDDVVLALKKRLKSEDYLVRQSAVIALTRIDPGLIKESMPLLIETLKTGTLAYELDAVIALGGIGPEARDAVPAILASMNRHPDFVYNYYAALKSIGTPEALKALEPYEQERARRKKLVKPISMLAETKLGSLSMAAVFWVLFLWSRSRRDKYSGLIYRPLLLPAVIWGLLVLDSFLDEPLMQDPFFRGLYGFGFYIGVFIITLAGLLPWWMSFLWRKRR